MTTDLRHLKQQIDLGFQAVAFLESDVGRHLTKRAEEEIDAAVERLKRADPEDTKGIRAIQNEISIAEKVLYWLAEMITTGENAQEQFIDQS